MLIVCTGNDSLCDNLQLHSTRDATLWALSATRFAMGHTNCRQKMLVATSSHKHCIHAGHLKHHHRLAIRNGSDCIYTLHSSQQTYAMERTSSFSHVAGVSTSSLLEVTTNRTDLNALAAPLSPYSSWWTFNAYKTRKRPIMNPSPCLYGACLK
jgi:hypothetical protein